MPVWNTTLSPGVCVDQEDVGAALCPYKSTSPAQNGSSSCTRIYFYMLRFPRCFCLTCLQVDFHKLPDGTLLHSPPPSNLKWASRPVFPPLKYSHGDGIRDGSSRVKTGGRWTEGQTEAVLSRMEVSTVCHVSVYSVCVCVCVCVWDSAGNLAPIKPSKLVLYCRSLACCFFIYLLTGFNRSHRFYQVDFAPLALKLLNFSDSE